ncbi:hypothetical protein L1987_46034 [Smallanthus sonchifolius]|uniref:Uncharacterized protein n=1 Tax=Smallanthus sonchifolius TaxID=185202 RepID=A0ACB9FZL3_9ASTR|nr:hypothetical protein L1987_46034 [Smallanthus sonchifolius]
MSRLNTPSVGAALASHMDVDKDQMRGKIVLGLAAKSSLKPMTLELGKRKLQLSPDIASTSSSRSSSNFSGVFDSRIHFF